MMEFIIYLAHAFSEVVRWGLLTINEYVIDFITYIAPNINRMVVLVRSCDVRSLTLK